MLPIYIYMLTYILPTFLLITLATYVILHNNRAVENRLIFVLLMMFCVTLVGEFLRHVSPFSYNPRIAVYVVGFSTSIAMAIVFHLQFILLKQHCPITIHPLVPFLGYLFISLHAIITLFFVKLSVANFYQSGIWTYRENMLYNLWLYGIVGVTSITSFFPCCIQARYFKKRCSSLESNYTFTIFYFIVFNKRGAAVNNNTATSAVNRVAGNM